VRLLLRVLFGLLVAAGVLVGGTLTGARFADGPLGIVAGGPLTAGELVSGAEPDWSFVRGLPTIELQLQEPPRSRTTWVLLHEGRLFVPSGYMQSWWGQLWKQWPPEAERDGLAIVRIAGKRYARTLVRIMDPALAHRADGGTEPQVRRRGQRRGSGVRCSLAVRAGAARRWTGLSACNASPSSARAPPGWPPLLN